MTISTIITTYASKILTLVTAMLVAFGGHLSRSSPEEFIVTIVVTFAAMLTAVFLFKRKTRRRVSTESFEVTDIKSIEQVLNRINGRVLSSENYIRADIEQRSTEVKNSFMRVGDRLENICNSIEYLNRSIEDLKKEVRLSLDDDHDSDNDDPDYVPLSFNARDDTPFLYSALSNMSVSQLQGRTPRMDYVTKPRNKDEWIVAFIGSLARKYDEGNHETALRNTPIATWNIVNSNFDDVEGELEYVYKVITE